MTRLAAVLGSPIGHSKSPKLHGYWLRKYNIDGHYVPLHVDPENLENMLNILPQIGFQGVNITIPHKESVLKFSDEITQSAKAIGAANTLTFQNGKIKADNTDGYGFIQNIHQMAPDWNFAGNIALVLGAGGAARAVIWSLLQSGVDNIILSNRTQSRAEDLQNLFGSKIIVAEWSNIEKYVDQIDLLVNTTSLGMIGQPDLKFDLQKINQNVLVTDIIYTPLQTQLLKDAKNRGCITVDGLGMLLHQAAPGFEAWFGQRPTIDSDVRTHILS
ncbi:shikimate dehydrogenase [Parasulfitobacter algicola]|uniref:Shikimate dehydrogenase (NADP(+)) n=1 Tax=Parasulfitobacter algicola TaxID=2614809 RepID=A0ABX2IL42_9RHOB|nr:shikimate dehydrogenase [Sulfitobacter algicola]NSX53583.1 shikimate dehydrogenase [Sulfitobacter algicola]